MYKQDEYLQDDYQEEEFETLHVYLYEEKPRRPMSQQTRDNLLGAIIILSYVFAGILAVWLIPPISSYTLTTLQVPAIYLPLKTYTAKAAIIPTGTKTIPATTANGILTVYNGSILSQQLPSGFILTGKDGVEIATDQAVTVPGGNAPNYGVATVPAHAVQAGVTGNIPVYDIISVYGSDLTIKNVTSFSGGNDPSTVTFATSDDTHTALTNARYTLIAQEKKQPDLLVSPCQEKTEQKDLTLTVSWDCQFVTYTTPPGVQIVSTQVKGKVVLLQVKVLTRPRTIIVK